MNKPFSAACERNRAPILAILKQAFAGSRRVLEIGSGTGQHAVYFGEHLPHLTWQTSDLPDNHPGILAWLREAALPNVLPPLWLDAGRQRWSQVNEVYDGVFTANTCHIMAWHQVGGMFAGIGRVLVPGGVLCIYGPFKENGRFSGHTDEQFDSALKDAAPHMGIRDVEAVLELAAEQGLMLQANHAMPANNRLLVWQRFGPSSSGPG
ncbi:DUF938 domain-containing protein [Noviherbaspirillum sp.]|uniref:DUF938 domain-containing protein n=1 Tax=Noviherbaspirillum sp. TaxID=1926288 RepID=UPI002FE246EB